MRVGVVTVWRQATPSGRLEWPKTRRPWCSGAGCDKQLAQPAQLCQQVGRVHAYRHKTRALAAYFGPVFATPHTAVEVLPYEPVRSIPDLGEGIEEGYLS